MKSIETLATLTADGVLTAKIPLDIPPGDHQVIIVIDERPRLRNRPQVDKFAVGEGSENSNHQTVMKEPLRFSAYEVGLISDDFTFRREDLYDDDI